jgi:integrase
VNRPTRIPSYRFHKPSGQAIVVISGKMIYLGRYGSMESHDEYNRIVAEWLAGSATRQPGESTESLQADLTVARLMRDYYRHCQSYYVKNGAVTNQVRMIRLALGVLRRLYGHTLVRDFGPLALKACRAEFIKNELSRRECNRRTDLIKQAFRWAVENELAPAGTYHALQAVTGLRKGRSQARETTPIGPVPDEILERTITYLCPTVAAMVRLQLVSAMRPGELVIMRACDLNLSGPVWEYRPCFHKAEHHDKAKVIMLGPKAQEIIRPLLCLDFSNYLFSPIRADEEQAAARRAQRKTKLWPSHVKHQEKRRQARERKVLHDHYDVNAYRRAIARACDQAFPHPSLSQISEKDLTTDQKTNLKAWRKNYRWHPHQLRHARATLIRRRFGIEAAQAVLGHSELSTSEIYAEKNLDVAREVMRKIG